MVKRDRRGRWESVRSPEACTVGPSDLVARRLNGREAGECIFWVDATGADSSAVAWADYARSSAGNPDSPRFCIGMSVACATACAEDKGLRRRAWRDFVTVADSRVLAERAGRYRGSGPLHIALKGALVAELAGDDLAAADRLSRDPLSRIVDAKEYAGERIWAAQVSVMFPVLERERRYLLGAYRSLWQLPHTRKDGREVQSLEKLEIGDMVHQAQHIRALKSELPRLRWIHRVRNALAHGEPVTWGTLMSPVALEIADFRE